MSGQSLIRPMRVRAPVITEIPAITINTTAEAQYTIVGANSPIGANVRTRATSTPRKMSRTPSMSHSISRMRLLSGVIGSNSSKMLFVGISICASPHAMMMADPAYSIAELNI